MSRRRVSTGGESWLLAHTVTLCEVGESVVRRRPGRNADRRNRV